MSSTSPGKLVGWKAIADYLNTSVRTAERWERELGLPVHHAGSSRGYTVFGYAEELEVWLAGPKGEGASITDRQGPETSTVAGTQTPAWRRSQWVAIAAIAVATAGLILAVLWFHTAQPPKIGSITFQGRQLLAWGGGKVLWSYDFGQQTRIAPDENLNQNFRVIPGKGGHDDELIVVAPLLVYDAGDLSTDALYCFSSSGRVKWHHVFADSIRFGGEECGPRWRIANLAITGESGTWSAWCTICSHPTSVSMVVKIDPKGNTSKYFVNYGHLGRLNEWPSRDRTYLLAGGINNETDDGMLAVLDETKPSGHSPQADTLSACDACPPGQPFRYFVFPSSEVSRATGNPYNGVIAILVSNAQIQVMTGEGTVEGGIWALYGISEALVPRSVFFSDKYRGEHQLLEAQGKIKHTLDTCPERLKPVVVHEWSPQEGWKNIMLPPIESRAAGSALGK